MRGRNLRLVFFGLLIVISSIALPRVTHAGWLDFFFPTIEQGPDPSKTLRAPFADEDAVLDDVDASGAAVTALNLRHRPDSIITQWVDGVIPEMLSYSAADYKNQYRQKIVNFSKVGAQEYGQFLQKQNFLTTLQTGRYDISGFIVDDPIVVNEGDVDGRYRWLYRANIMVTYIESGTKDYKSLGSDGAISQELVLTFQLGRTGSSLNEHGLTIETWQAVPKVE